MRKSILFILSLFPLLLFPQATNNVLVKVGNAVITSEEFKLKFAFTPQIKQNQQQTEDSLKRNFLYSLIAEKLWALEAINLKYDTSDIMQFTFNIVKKMILRDALFKEEITSNVKVTDEEINAQLPEALTKIKVNFLFSSDSLEAKNLYAYLKKNGNFDSLFATRQEAELQPNPLPAEKGKIKDHILNLLYKLNLGEISKPIRTETGWFIFRITEKEKAEGNLTDIINKVRNSIFEEKAADLYEKFYKNFFVGKKIEADGFLFWIVAGKISKALKQKKNSSKIEENQFIYLEQEDFLKIEKQFSDDTLNLPFVKIEGDPITLKEFLRDLLFNGFYSDKNSVNIVSAKLNSRVKRMIEYELLARKAFRKGLDKLPEVQSRINMWKDYYLAQLYKKKFIQNTEISDNELNKALKKKENKDFVQVNIVEILTDSLETVEKIFDELEKGTDFKSLASKYTKRKWTKEKKGEFGFFPSYLYGDIGRIAAKLNIGEIYGPLKVLEGYSVFKLIDKKIDSTETGLDLAEQKRKIRERLIFQKRFEALETKTVRLAQKYGVDINNSLFDELDAKTYDMYVIQQLGFGGTMQAFPLTTPFTEWIRKSEKLKNKLP